MAYWVSPFDMWNAPILADMGAEVASNFSLNNSLGYTKEQAARIRTPMWHDTENHPDMMLLQELVWMHEDLVAGRKVTNASMLVVAAGIRDRRVEKDKAKA
jgi:hypothetical protein